MPNKTKTGTTTKHIYKCPSTFKSGVKHYLHYCPHCKKVVNSSDGRAELIKLRLHIKVCLSKK